MADSAKPSKGRSRKMSSSADLSTPSKSPSPLEDSITLDLGPPHSTSAAPTSNDRLEAPAKPKRVRKLKIAADGTEIVPKPRKSRPKKTDTESSSKSTTSKTAASSSKATAVSQASTQAASRSSKQPKINEVLNTSSNNLSVQQTSNLENNSKTNDQIGTKSEAIHKPSTIKVEPHPMTQQPQTTNTYQSQPVVQTPQPVVSTSGQHYDPIRSSTILAPRSVPVSNPSTPVVASPTKPTSRASMSPSIASLINPPSATTGTTISRPTSSLSPAQSMPAQLVQSATNSPAIRPVVPVPMPLVRPPTPAGEQPDAMDIDPKPADVSRKTSISTGSAASPNPIKPKDKPAVITPKLPPLPGQGYATSKASGARAIVIHVPLKGERNKYVNFHQLAVEKYGFDAVHPKLALQREHMARVAANAAALERKPGAVTSNDDMSIEGTDNEAELSSGSKRKPTTEPGEPVVKKKRLTYEDFYDKDDPFVDDAEMVWEEQAAAVKDGFFVYSGPLVVPSGDAAIEKADSSAAKKKPRTSKPAASRTSAAKTTKDKADEKDKDKKDDSEKKTAKTVTNGSKDGTVPAKPPPPPRKRYTKAEQEARKAEKERIAREKAAAAGVAPPGDTATKTSTTASTSAAQTPTALTGTVSSAATTPKPASAVPSTA